MTLKIPGLSKPSGEAVKQLSEGNIDYQMSTNRIDELGRLVDSFNTMTQRIREMLHSRDRLLQDVSHELRSPLTRVKVALEFLEENKTKKNIREDISEIETMVTELLETDSLKSPYGGIKLEETNVLNLMRDVCAEFQDEKHGIKIVSFPKNISIKIDPKRIKILLRNILDISNYSVFASKMQFMIERASEINKKGDSRQTHLCTRWT